MTWSERELLSHVHTAETTVAQGAFEVLYREHFAVVWKFAYRFTHDRASAQDLAQDVFLSIWDRRRELHIQGSLRSYLLGAVRHRALNLRRDETTKHLAVDSAVAHEDPIASGIPGSAPDESAAALLIERQVMRAIAGLPERQRSALILRWEHDLTNREIAHALGVGEAAVSRLLLRAAEAVRKVIPRDSV